MKPYLFLDVDGVLNKQQQISNEPITKEEKCFYQAFPTTNIDNLFFLRSLNFQCVNYLSMFYHHYDIILSSSWRLYLSRVELATYIREYFKLSNFNFIDETPYLHHANRWTEIKTWLQNNEKRDFIVIDDDLDIPTTHNIRTLPDVGLTEALAFCLKIAPNLFLNKNY